MLKEEEEEEEEDAGRNERICSRARLNDPANSHEIAISRGHRGIITIMMTTTKKRKKRKRRNFCKMTVGLWFVVAMIRSGCATFPQTGKEKMSPSR